MAQTRSRRSFALFLTLALLWMALIFFLSAQPYEKQDLKPSFASAVSESKLAEWLPRIEFYFGDRLVTWKKPYDFVEFFVRKGGHVAEYAVLCLLWLAALSAGRLPFRRAALAAGAVSFLYACSDEWHQTFVAGRTGSPLDVGVDTLGILLGIGLYGAVRLIRQKRGQAAR